MNKNTIELKISHDILNTGSLTWKVAISGTSVNKTIYEISNTNADLWQLITGLHCKVKNKLTDYDRINDILEKDDDLSNTLASANILERVKIWQAFLDYLDCKQ